MFFSPYFVLGMLGESSGLYVRLLRREAGHRKKKRQAGACPPQRFRKAVHACASGHIPEESKNTGDFSRCLACVLYAGYSPIVATAGCGRNIRPITSNLYWRHLYGLLYETFTIVSHIRHKNKWQFQQEVPAASLHECARMTTRIPSGMLSIRPVLTIPAFEISESPLQSVGRVKSDSFFRELLVIIPKISKFSKTGCFF
jgi:hypothetical protein